MEDKIIRPINLGLVTFGEIRRRELIAEHLNMSVEAVQSGLIGTYNLTR